MINRIKVYDVKFNIINQRRTLGTYKVLNVLAHDHGEALIEAMRICQEQGEHIVNALQDYFIKIENLEIEEK